MATLIVTAGDIGWHEFKLQGEAVIGRDQQCDVIIAQSWISRQHARITPAGGRYFLEDLNTPNGTLVNGAKIKKSELHDGDRIRLGVCELTFTLGKTPAPLRPVVGVADTNATVVDSVSARSTIADDASLPDSVKVRQLETHLKALQQVAETACGELEIESLLGRVLDELLRVFPQAMHAHAVVLRLGEEGGDLHLSAARAGQADADVRISATLLEIATRDRNAVLAKDAMSDSRFARATSIIGQSLRSTMCAPLVVGENVLGAIQVDTTSSGLPFTVEDLRLLATVAGQAAVAAESARLHGELVAKQRLAAVGETISGLAHCIKNVLNGLKGGAYILDVGIQKQDVEKTSKGWDMVKRNNDFMFDLVKEMLAYCKKEVVRREPTELGELLDGTVLMVQEAAAQNGVEVSLSLNGEVPEVKIDQTGMKRAVLNLLSNAVEACPEGSHVRASAGVDEPSAQLLITVEDDGPGIPAEIRERLFDPFFTTKGSRGTGLGLPLVRKVVEEHGGRIEVDSELGRGTAFRISIPMATAAAETHLLK